MNEVSFNAFPSLLDSECELLSTIYGNLLPRMKDCKKMLVSSACNQEGKTFFALQFARCMAQTGRKVIFVDADLRRSTLAKQYKLTSKEELPGLEDYLTGLQPLSNILCDTNISNLFLIPSFKHADDSLGLLDGQNFRNLLDILAERYDLVIVDSPSAGIYMDASRIASHCDGAVMVARFNKTRKSDFTETCKRIEMTGCPVLGTVMNRLSFLSFSARKYYNLLYRTYKSTR